jgi:hypothetical protein
MEISMEIPKENKIEYRVYSWAYVPRNVSHTHVYSNTVHNRQTTESA